MGKYSIKELEKLSGIKAHTIRIWEKRHNIITPSRTDTNIRFYSDHDLKKIMNVAIVNNSGIKISHIARMSNDELNKLIEEQSEIAVDVSPIDQLIVAMVELDEANFNNVLNRLTEKLGFEDLIVKVVYPFMEKIGILWQTGNITPAQEHFISNLVRQKMMVAIDGLPIPPKDSAKAVLFLPENEYHEIGLLFYQFILRKNGILTFYLGQSVPYSDLLSIVEAHKPNFIVSSLITTFKKGDLRDFITKLSKDFPDQKILMSGRAIIDFSFEELSNVSVFNSPTGLKSIITT